MRIASGRTDAKLAFVAVDVTDLKTRETGLTGFTVYRSRNGGAATAYTTPTVAELSAANMPGVYVLTIDEDTTLGAGVDEEEYVVHITQASMAPVTRAVEIFRPKITEGNTHVVSAGGSGDAQVKGMDAGTLTAAAVGTGAIDADALAADAGTEIAGAVWDMDATGHQTQGSFGQVLGDSGADTDTVWGLANASLGGVLATAAAVSGVQADTDDIQTRLPAALVGGRMDSSVGAMATGVLTAAALATDAVTEIVDAVWANATRTLTSLGTDIVSAASVAAAAANKIADHVLRRTTANAEASSDGDAVGGRSLYGAIARIAHKWSISGTTRTITKSDDTTTLTTETLTGTAGADPITTVDPAA